MSYSKTTQYKIVSVLQQAFLTRFNNLRTKKELLMYWLLRAQQDGAEMHLQHNLCFSW
jgi:hypothetical protein